MKTTMKNTALRIIAVTLGILLCAAPQAGQAGTPEVNFEIVGTWEGALALPNGTTLRAVFHITKAEDGTLSSTMDSPDQGAFGIATDKTVFKDNTLRIEMSQIGGVYEGTVNDEEALDGTWQQGGQSFPLVLKRAETTSGS